MESSKAAYLTFYLVLTAVFSFVFFFGLVIKPANLGFWTRLWASVVGIPLGFVGALAGDFVRRLTIPDAIFTTGGLIDILKTKLFWFCVPQLVGMAFGIALANSWVVR